MRSKEQLPIPIGDSVQQHGHRRDDMHGYVALCPRSVYRLVHASSLLLSSPPDTGCVEYWGDCLLDSVAVCAKLRGHHPRLRGSWRRATCHHSSSGTHCPSLLHSFRLPLPYHLDPLYFLAVVLLPICHRPVLKPTFVRRTIHSN
ncbi:hypothetical protein IAQ61_006979 [Plenodomus lingam]|uniref:uncharacterized protein n=1 Tax=Leptosphaeria maculans TaxID=5022 RepID=UPI00332C2234|nr:hypothetical protein IAQ61_006979 [Plenodomus lingam]